MSTPPNFPAILASAIAGISIIGWLSEHNRAEEYWKELAQVTGAQRQCCWTERIERSDEEIRRSE
jgi:hypothetical protein